MKKHLNIPAGHYRCILLRRRQTEAGGEMLVEIATGRFRGRRIRFEVTGDRRLARAVALEDRAMIDIVLRYASIAGGREVPVVPNFAAATSPVMVSVLGGVPTGDGGKPTVWPISYIGPADVRDFHEVMLDQAVHSPQMPCPVFPESLACDVIEELRTPEHDDQHPGDEGGQRDPNEDYPVVRAAKQAERDYAYCLLQAGLTSGIEAVPFEASFSRYCRAEHAMDGGQSVLVSAYQYSHDAVSNVPAAGAPVLGYRSTTWARWLHVGFPGAGEPERSLAACRRFVRALRRLGVERRHIMVFTLGDGDLEVMFPAAAGLCLPRPGFEFAVGYFCQVLADWSVLTDTCDVPLRDLSRWFPDASRAIDLSLYRPMAMVRMPNTPAAKPGAYKVRVTQKELNTLDADALGALAATPRPFNPPGRRVSPWSTIQRLWRYAVAVAVCRSQSVDQITPGNRWVHAGTFEFISFGSDTKTASEKLYRAAMNLHDFGCPPLLVEALLAPAALLSGMKTAKVRATLSHAVHASRRERLLPIEVYPELLDVNDQDNEE